jgi:hypothetical protein
VAEVSALFARHAELLRELAALEERIGTALEAGRPPEPDRTLCLEEAATLMGEPPETFRRRLEYRKALVSRPGELRLRFSAAALERVRRDRLGAAR